MLHALRPAVWALALSAGLAHGHVASRTWSTDCRWTWPETPASRPLTLRGVVTGIDGPGRARLRIERPCSAEIQLQVAGPARPGHEVQAVGHWQPRNRATPGLDPLYAGRFRADEVHVLAPARGIGAALARYRAHLSERIDQRFRREAPMVQALLIARRGELDEATRTAFLRAGTTHLLAISGFHVGIIAALAIWTAGQFVPKALAVSLGAGLAWAYVALLGFPDSALRAAVLLTLVTCGRWLQRPVVAAGALGTALLGLSLVDPAMAGRVGAQLSFAGALGLAIGASPLTRSMERYARRYLLARGSGRAVQFGLRLAKPMSASLAAALVATAATLPLVAWHFERIALVGIPATLAATPFIALALPAIIAVLAFDQLSQSSQSLQLVGDLLAHPLATSVEGLLSAARAMVTWMAAPAWASVPLPRPDAEAVVVGLAVGVGLLGAFVHVGRLTGVGTAARVALVSLCGASALVVAPVLSEGAHSGILPGPGRRFAVELHMLDAGQGDALALRSPAGRWMVIDAGPPPGERIATQLARLGVRQIDLLLLTHPDADHVGGAVHLLQRFHVAGIAGPGTPRAEGPWRDALQMARTDGIAWRTLHAGTTWSFDGVSVRVLHPQSAEGSAGPAEDIHDANYRSVVLLVSWRGRHMLLTGDADVLAERSFAAAAGDVDVLKVGHHGSRTSTGEELLERTRPEVALISAGRGNRYQHPHRAVLTRLQQTGLRLYRTDEDGAVRVKIDNDGTIEVSQR